MKIKMSTRLATLNIVVGIGLLFSVVAFKLLRGLPFEIVPALVLVGLGAFALMKKRFQKFIPASPQPVLVQVSAPFVAAFFFVAFVLPVYLFFFTNLGPAAWLPCILISQQFLMPGHWSRFLTGASLFLLMWVCTLLDFKETPALMTSVFAVSLILIGESDIRKFGGTSHLLR
jgi:hypothetical protein